VTLSRQFSDTFMKSQVFRRARFLWGPEADRQSGFSLKILTLWQISLY
jgi:hypothetical protein